MLLCLYICLPASLSVYIFVCLYIFLYLSLFLSVSVCVFFVCLIFSLSVNVPVWLYVCISDYLSVIQRNALSPLFYLTNWLPLRLPLFLSRFFTLCDCLCIWIFNACFWFKSNKYAPLRIYLVKDLLCSSPLYAKHPKHPHFGSTGVNMIVEAVSYFLTSSCLLWLVMLWHKLDWNNLLQSVEIHGLEVSL